jgi:biopolymer transport protein TolR
MSFGRMPSKAGAQPMSDINMTPLIDVMLVLLVIFLITAPLMSTGLRLDLPKTDAGTASEASAVFAVSVNEQGQLFVGDEPTTAAQLQQRARAAAQRSPGLEVQLRADQRVPYGRVAELIGSLQQAGLTRIGFVTEAPVR